MNFLEWLNSHITIYRGESSYNRGGRYWTTDREWARQFTQSGRDSEIKTARIESSRIYREDPLPNATDEIAMDKAMKAARDQGFAAIWVNEGLNEPNSIYVLIKSALRQGIAN